VTEPLPAYAVPEQAEAAEATIAAPDAASQPLATPGD